MLNVQIMAGTTTHGSSGIRIMSDLPLGTLGTTNHTMGQPFGTIPTIGAGTTTSTTWRTRGMMLIK